MAPRGWSLAARGTAAQGIANSRLHGRPWAWPIGDCSTFVTSSLALPRHQPLQAALAQQAAARWTKANCPALGGAASDASTAPAADLRTTWLHVPRAAIRPGRPRWDPGCRRSASAAQLRLPRSSDDVRHRNAHTRRPPVLPSRLQVPGARQAAVPQVHRAQAAKGGQRLLQPGLLQGGADLRQQQHS